ncbi:F-box plant-like protein, putative [Medicago truncatula]|uniref:F-box plant-like protein, putative n=2 Tax=Medicago truncatula TaxID=3880 RepID=A0A072V5I9_MEDTR|nr:F-box plant-like protein, putative [Medicago truncatula]
MNTSTKQKYYKINNKSILQILKPQFNSTVLEAVSDRIEMHHNIGERNNWNNLLLNSINMITLTAKTMSGVAAVTSGEVAPLLALKLSSALLFSAANGLLLIMNKIQPSQLTEEQRNATRLFNEKYVKGEMEKYKSSNKIGKMNEWSEELEMEMRDVVEVIKRKDVEDYDRLGNIALKVNKSLAIAGPLLSGIAAIGSTFIGNSSLAAFVPLLASVINTFEHGGQVGMVFEMYRASAGFFNLIETSIESTLGEKDLEKRENGELFEMKMALQLGKSVSELRELASKSASYRMEGVDIDEFSSKIF